MEADNQSGELCCARILRVKPPWCNEIASKQRGCTVQRVKLDAIDLRILRDLQDDGRMTNVELSQRAGISAPPCLRRVRALEESGYVHGYHAEIDGALMGFKEVYFALVGLDSQSQAVLKSFEDLMADWPEIREYHMIRGGGDFLLKIVARNKEHRDKLTMGITEAPHVTTVSTLETIRTSKNLPGVPINTDVLHDYDDEA